jgi:hypothetical protein
LIRTVGGEAARFEAGGIEELALMIKAEGTRHGFAWRLSDRCQEPGGGVDGKTGDAIMAAVRGV